VDVTFRQLDIPFVYWCHVVLSYKLIYVNMSNKQQAANFFHSREIENALRESIASNPATNRTIFLYAIDALLLNYCRCRQLSDVNITQNFKKVQ